MAPVIKFGTDGWRAIIAEDFTFDNVRACAQAVADYLKDSGLASRGLVIGYDTRFASEAFAAAVAEVVAANDVKVYLSPRVTPTPVVSYGILDRQAGGGVVITASHNPAAWNGFKYKPEYAGSASPEVVAELERRLANIEASQVPRLALSEGLAQGVIEYYDPTPAYLAHLGQLVDLPGLREAGLKVIVDPMFGAGAGFFRDLLSGGTTEVSEINAERNPVFPGIRQPEPFPPNLDRLSAAVVERGVQVGLATDGDADRLGVVDEQGQFITPLQTLSLLALYLMEVRGQRGPIVKSITSSAMLYRLGEIFDVPVYETPVGFKFIGPKMLEIDAMLGGEESGGYGFRGHVPERDGILAGLYFLDLMAQTGKTPSALVEYLYSKVGPHYYRRIDLQFSGPDRPIISQRLSAARPGEIEGVAVEQIDTTDGFRFVLADGSWLMIRFSGTEPLLRIYAETNSTERLERLLAAGRRLAGV